MQMSFIAARPPSTASMLPSDQCCAECGLRQQGQRRYVKAGSIKSEQELSSTIAKMQEWCQEIARENGMC
jgi:hypothetical protein